MTAAPEKKHEHEPVPAVKVTDLTVAYGQNVVLDGVSFEIPQGLVTAIIGPNGSGKTTLMKSILGLTDAQYGTIEIFGKPLSTMREMVGYVPQNFSFERDFPLTVAEFMDLARHSHCPKDRIEEKIHAVGLAPTVLSQNIGSLSGGQLQRVLIAQAILNNPSILFLDEPSTGIDIVGEAAFYEIIKQLNEETDTTILLVSHDISVVSTTVDMVVCVNKRLMCSGPPNIALSDKTLKELFGHDVSPYHHHAHETDHEHGRDTK